MVFGPQPGPPCVLYVRAVILVTGNPWGMPPKLSFEDFGFFRGVPDVITLIFLKIGQVGLGPSWGETQKKNTCKFS